MSIKKILSLVFVLIPFAVSAQNFRAVRGSVYDADGVPLPIASVTYPGNTEKYQIEPNGNFIIQIPQHVRYLTAELEGYIPVTIEVDGSYMVFKLKVDKKYYENKAKAEAEAKALAEKEAAAKAKAEEEARLAAEREAAAKAKAEADAKAAAEKAEAEAKAKAEKEAEAKAKAEADAKAAAAKAEAEAKAKAEREAAAKAKAEAEAKAKAEREAAAKAKAEADAKAAAEKAEAEAKARAEKEAAAREQARLKAEEEARLEAIRKAKADSVAKAKADAKMAAQNRRKEINAAYNKAYRNKGFTQSLEVSYAYPMHEPMRLVYENLGYRTFTTLHPIEATYTLGYRFCNWVALSVGSGIYYETVDLRAYGDNICHELYKGSVNETESLFNFSVPAFLNLRFYLSRGKIQPMISLTGGAYLYSFSDIDVDPMADAGLGANFRLGRWCNMYLLASVGMVPIHDFSQNNRYVRNTALAPRVKLGFNF